MIEGNAKVLDYIDYKNKLRTREWEERLWKLRLNGNLPDPRAEQDRARYSDLQARLERARSLVGQLRGGRRSIRPEFLRPATTN
jgi:hypothetical protein